MPDDFDFDIRVACCHGVVQHKRDDYTTRWVFIAPAMAHILIAENVALNDHAACHTVLAQFFDAEDVDRLLELAIADAVEMRETTKGAAQ